MIKSIPVDLPKVFLRRIFFDAFCLFYPHLGLLGWIESSSWIIRKHFWTDFLCLKKRKIHPLESPFMKVWTYVLIYLCDLCCDILVLRVHLDVRRKLIVICDKIRKHTKIM